LGSSCETADSGEELVVFAFDFVEIVRLMLAFFFNVE